MIAIVDYGLGNVKAFYKGLASVGAKTTIANKPHHFENCAGIILPGVGSFDWAMNLLTLSGMKEPLDKLVLKNRVPVLGVCVGMQIMAASSEEGSLRGLNWINAKVKKLGHSRQETCQELPHMGWNTIKSASQNELFNELNSHEFYFLHSFALTTDDSSLTIATSDYHGKFVAAIQHGNIYGTQFHPEKSHDAGRTVLNNFRQICQC